MFGIARDQLSPPQMRERSLDRAPGKTGRVGDRAQTGLNRFPFIPRSLSVKMKINQIRGRLLIVPE
jgi:hypothetical protein